MSIFDPEEYFLAYENGEVWYNVDSSFEDQLRSVVMDWAWASGLSEVTFTTTVSNDQIAYLQLLYKVWQSFKPYQLLINEKEEHYNRQEGRVPNDSSAAYVEKDREPFLKPKFIQDTSRLYVQQAENTATGPGKPSRRKIFKELFSDLLNATITANRLASSFFGSPDTEKSRLREMVKVPPAAGKQRIHWTCVGFLDV